MEVIDNNTINFYSVVAVSVISLSNYNTWTIFVSAPFNATTGSNAFTHNLWLIQSDVEEWRYSIFISWKVTSWSKWWFSNKWYVTGTIDQSVIWDSWAAVSPSSDVKLHTNVWAFYVASWPWITQHRVIIKKNR